MAAPLNFGRDVQGFNSYAPAPSTVMYSVTLAAGTPAEITVPESAKVWIVSFSYYLNNVWVDVTGAAADVPAGNTFDSTTSRMNPASYELLGGTNISVVTAQTTADVSVAMWPVSYS